MTSFFTGYMALGTGSNSFTEQTGSNYSRQSITFAPAIPNANRRQVNSDSVSFSATGTWTATTQLALFAASSGGSPLVWWNKDKTITLISGETYTINDNTLNLFFNDVASAPGAATYWSSGDIIGSTASGQSLNVGASTIVADGVMQAGSGGAVESVLGNAVSGV